MEMLVVSYSLTGNNEALAAGIAAELGADHIRITETKRRTVGVIALDMLLNRTPKISPAADEAGGYDLVVLVGPVWMGQVASPLRPWLELLETNPAPYAFISISGGALGPNPKLGEDVKKRAGREPAALVDLHIADLLPADPKPSMKETSSYRLSEIDALRLTRAAVEAVREATGEGLRRSQAVER